MLMVGERRRSTQIRFPVRNMHKGVIRIYIYWEIIVPGKHFTWIIYEDSTSCSSRHYFGGNLISTFILFKTIAWSNLLSRGWKKVRGNCFAFRARCFRFEAINFRSACFPLVKIYFYNSLRHKQEAYDCLSRASSAWNLSVNKDELER